MAGDRLLSNVVASQVVFHARFGGVVPEIASRKHTEALVATIDEALRLAALALAQETTPREETKVPSPANPTNPANPATDPRLALAALDGIAVTDRPGLIGALVVGQAYAKGLAWAAKKPLYGINHLEGHLYATVIDTGELPTPFVALIVSGGHTTLVYSPRPHTYETLGETLDDAAGEAFDKVAKVLGLGYPGGPILSKLAASGNPQAIDFPRAMLKSGDYHFSLSGLKTAVITYIRERESKGLPLNIPDIAASFQQAIIDVQVAKTLRAAQEKAVKHVILAGGVAANKTLRDALTTELATHGIETLVPPLTYCGDNAAMIARAAVARLVADADDVDALPRARPLPLTAEASASASLETQT